MAHTGQRWGIWGIGIGTGVRAASTHRKHPAFGLRDSHIFCDGPSSLHCSELVQAS